MAVISLSCTTEFKDGRHVCVVYLQTHGLQSSLCSVRTKPIMRISVSFTEVMSARKTCMSKPIGIDLGFTGVMAARKTCTGKPTGIDFAFTGWMTRSCAQSG